MFTGAVATQVAQETGDAAVTAGAAIGGGLVTLIAGFLGFFLGAIFLVVGLLVGRDKQVIVVKEGSSDQT